MQSIISMNGFVTLVIAALVGAIGTATISQSTYANHNIINRGECMQLVQSQGFTKEQAQQMCSDPNFIIYGGNHCVTYVEQFGYSRDAAHDICQAFFTHKFNKSNP